MKKITIPRNKARAARKILLDFDIKATFLYSDQLCRIEVRLSDADFEALKELL